MTTMSGNPGLLEEVERSRDGSESSRGFDEKSVKGQINVCGS